MASLNPLDSVFDLGKTALNKIWPDAGEEEKLKVSLILQELQAKTSIILAEVNSASWLTSNWRPVTMLVFTGLITARWLGFAAPNLSEAEYLKLWDIVQFGIGGYTVGRSVEKVVDTVGTALANRKL